MWKLLMSGLLYVASGANGHAEGSVSRYGMGYGSGHDGFRPFDAVVREYNASGDLFRIDGHCQSACTLFLAIRTVCITPAAQLLFHAGHTLGPERRISSGATHHMMSAYNERLRTYLRDGGHMNSLEFHTISGREMVRRFGYRACP